MRRRDFIAGLAGAATLRPIPGSAQRPQRNAPLVGVIWIGTASDQIPVRIKEALLRGLQENGYSDGQNIAVEHRYFGDGPGPLGNAAEELVRLGVDVIVAMGTPAALAARKATSSIPIVAVSMADPVADGLYVHRPRTRPQTPSIAPGGIPGGRSICRAAASPRVRRAHDGRNAVGIGREGAPDRR
jgi:putative tryptophan/tyrosine transport system substrate-binding protein